MQNQYSIPFPNFDHVAIISDGQCGFLSFLVEYYRKVGVVAHDQVV